MPNQAQVLPSAHKLAQFVLKYGEREKPEHCGALKVLHKPEDTAGYPTEQLERMKREVYALKKFIHPNVVKVLDERIEDRWFVTEYFPQGSISNNRDGYRGDLLKCLVAIRPLVEGVAELHKRGLVHRDIKPENVFVSLSRGLMLGDFGLVYFVDEQRSRLSDTYENVGSRDWMPGWAMGIRVEQIRPTFDVFCLGKLLWWMASGKSKLRLWYVHDPEFELEKMFPDAPDINWARIILDKCVVEHEEDCKLPNAGALLEEIDRIVIALRRRGQVIGDGIARACRVCGLGRYVKYPDSDRRVELMSLGVKAQPKPSPLFQMYTCKHCGHAEFFFLPDTENPPPTT